MFGLRSRVICCSFHLVAVAPSAGGPVCPRTAKGVFEVNLTLNCCADRILTVSNITQPMGPADCPRRPGTFSLRSKDVSWTAVDVKESRLNTIHEYVAAAMARPRSHVRG